MNSALKTRMLYVEDSRMDQLLFRRLVSTQELPYDYEIADSVAEARDKLANERYEIVVTDYLLGDGTAFDIFEYVQDAPIIFLTGGGDEGTAVRAMKAGAYDYIIKGGEPSVQELLPIAVENALKQKVISEQARTLSHAIRGISENVYITDLKHRVKFVNEAFCQTYGYETGEIIGQHVSILWSGLGQEHVEGTLTSLIEEGRPSEMFHARKDGSHLPVSLSSSIISDDKGNALAIVGIGSDLTDVKHREQEKQQLEQQLVESQKLESLGRLAGGIAHDFNNILGSIMGYTELAIDDVAEDSLSYQNLSEVLTAAKRARDIVEQMLSFGRASENELTVTKLNSVVKEVLQLIRATLPSNIVISNDLARDLYYVEVDVSQVHRIVMNLCTNAAYAMKENGGKLKVSLANEQHQGEEDGTNLEFAAGDYVSLTIEDTGCGMSAEVKDKIFEPFFTTKPIGEGSGIGLSAVHGIVSEYGGFIRVESEPGRGTSISIFFPRYLGDLEGAETLANTERKQGSGRILLVDDEVTLVSVGKQMLERLGYSVTGVSDSEKALEIFSASPDDFDLIIADYMMPRLTGDVFVGKVLEIRGDIPVILCTGYGDNFTAESVKKMKFSDLMNKPIRFAELSEAVKRVLEASFNGVCVFNPED